MQRTMTRNKVRPLDVMTWFFIFDHAVRVVGTGTNRCM